MESNLLILQTLIHFPKAVAETIEKVISKKAYIPENIIEQIIKSLNMDIEELMTKLLPVAEIYSKVPVSNFKVGAAVLCNSGNIYLGSNMEFAGESLNNSVHAEQSAVNNAWLHGEKSIIKIAVTAAPCGHCRQFLNEVVKSDELKIILNNNESKMIEIFELAQLLPISFGPKDLNIKESFMNEMNHTLSLSFENDELINSALEAANKSYSPYSNNYSGVSIMTKDGNIYNGRYAENAAFNPSLLPLQSALAYMNMNSKLGSKNEIVDAVMVESKSIISQKNATERILSAVGNIKLRYYKIEN